MTDFIVNSVDILFNQGHVNNAFAALRVIGDLFELLLNKRLSFS